jgi:hypothetical protein
LSYLNFIKILKNHGISNIKTGQAQLKRRWVKIMKVMKDSKPQLRKIGFMMQCRFTIKLLKIKKPAPQAILACRLAFGHD